MTSITVACPLPPIDLSANKHPLWAQKASAIKTYRYHCGNLFKEAWRAAGCPKFSIPITIEMDFYLCHKEALACDDKTKWVIASKRYYFPKDVQNAIISTKALVDGIVDAGIVSNDSARYVQFGCTRLLTTKPQHKGRACVVVTLSCA